MYLPGFFFFLVGCWATIGSTIKQTWDICDPSTPSLVCSFRAKLASQARGASQDLEVWR